MDPKSRRSRRKPCTEKTIIVSNETPNLPPNVVGDNDMEQVILQLDRVTSCMAADLTDKNSKMVEEAIAGRQKAEAEVAYLKQELIKATHQGLAAEERLTHLDAALNGCMQQINSLREEQEEDDDNNNCGSASSNLHHEKTKKRLIEIELAEVKESLRRTTSENSHLRNALLLKDELIKELEQERQCLESEFEVLMARSESVEKENTLLKYECCALEREVTGLNEERRYYNSATKSIVSLKKVAELEAECQQLRVMVQKNVAGVVNVNSRRRRSNGSDIVCSREQQGGNIRKINFLVDRLCDVEEENNVLRNALSVKDTELRDSKLKCAETDYRLAVVEARMRDFTAGDDNMQQTQNRELPSLMNHRSSQDGDDQNGIVAAESWATVLLSRLEHSRKAGQEEEEDPNACDSKMSLMNHFVKESVNDESQENLAILVDHTESKQTRDHHLCKAITPSVHQGQVKCYRKDETTERSGGSNWPWDALQIIVEEHLSSKRSFMELLDDIKSALAQSCPGLCETSQTSSIRSSFGGTLSVERLLSSTDYQQEGTAASTLSESICRIIELLEGISPCSLTENSVTQQSSSTDYYSAYVFRWRSFELIGIIKRFILACSSLISSGDHNTFASELKEALEWTVGKCITLQDASQVRDKIRKHFGLDRSKSDGELDIPTAAAATTSGDRNNNNVLSQMMKIQSNLQEVNKGLRNELESADSANQQLQMEMRSVKEENKALQMEMRSVKEENKALMKQIQEAMDSIRRLQMEVEELGESKGVVDEQMENLKMINEDLDTRLSVARSKLNENFQQISSLEVELEDKNSCCEELEAVCLELQLQLEIVSKRGSPNPEDDLSGKNLGKGWDRRTALVRLTEHEKTIRAVETLMGDEYDSSPTTTTTTTNCGNIKQNQQQHLTLRDRMLADEDNEQHQPKEAVVFNPIEKQTPIQHNTDSMTRTIYQSPMDKILTLAIVPAAKKSSGSGFGVIRKFFWRRKWSTKKTSSVALHRTSSNLLR